MDIPKKQKSSLIVFDDKKTVATESVEVPIVRMKLKVSRIKATVETVLAPTESSAPSTPVTPKKEVMGLAGYGCTVRPEEAISNLYAIQYYIR